MSDDLCAKECSNIANYICDLSNVFPADIVKKIYNRLGQLKKGKKAVSLLESDPKISSKLMGDDGQDITENTASPENESSGSEKASDFIKGKTFVVTGDLKRYPERENFKKYIESCGGRLTGSVSGKTDYLITNFPDSGTTKIAKAKQLNVPIISEDEFWKLNGES
jgi:NAD-dependent DNA ligase